MKRILLLLCVLLLSGGISLVFGLAISMTNPFLGAMYSFFFSNVVGKQISKAIFTCFALHLGVNWAFNTYLPHFLVAYAPTILLCVLAVMLLSGAASLVLGLVIAITNPFLGAMYSFFFSNIIGKQISKAVFTSAALCVILYLMDYFHFVVILITPAALLTYIPLALAMLVLWFIIGHLL